jgi:hypothetical protein
MKLEQTEWCCQHPSKLVIDDFIVSTADMKASCFLPAPRLLAPNSSGGADVNFTVRFDTPVGTGSGGSDETTKNVCLPAAEVGFGDSGALHD